MPKKGTTTKTRTVTKKIKSYVSRKPHTGGAVSGAVAGLVGVLASKMLGAWSQPASDLGVGYFMKNDTLMTIGGRQIGAQLAAGGLNGAILGNGSTGGALLF